MRLAIETMRAFFTVFETELRRARKPRDDRCRYFEKQERSFLTKTATQSENR